MDIRIAKASTNGGRSFDAIWESELSALKKLVLQYFASQLEFTQSWISLSTICKMTGLSRSSVCRTIADLDQEGYLIREHRIKKDGSLDSNAYALTNKIFEIYYKKILLESQST